MTVPATDKAFAVRVAGASMSPTLREGDQVLVDPLRAPHPGDIIVTASTIHRLLWLDPWGGCWHRGDGRGSTIGRVPATLLEGVVLARFSPDGSSAIDDGPFLTGTPLGRAISIAEGLVRIGARKLRAGWQG